MITLVLRSRKRLLQKYGSASVCKKIAQALCVIVTTGLLDAYLSPSGAQSVKIVGIGATRCEKYLAEVNGNVVSEREYFAWAQGYMSGLLIRAPAGKDEDLNLEPAAFPLLKQAAFLRTFCQTDPSADFSDGIHALYRTLRARPP